MTHHTIQYYVIYCCLYIVSIKAGLAESKILEWFHVSLTNPTWIPDCMQFYCVWYEVLGFMKICTDLWRDSWTCNMGLYGALKCLKKFYCVCYEVLQDSQRICGGCTKDSCRICRGLVYACNSINLWINYLIFCTWNKQLSSTVLDMRNSSDIFTFEYLNKIAISTAINDSPLIAWIRR